VQNKWPEPAWIAELPECDRNRARTAFYLNLAATFHNDRGSLNALSCALGFSKPYLNVCRARGVVSPTVAVQIESKLGRERFPRELFNSIFIVAEK
jgi:hypothetical protein